MPDVPDVDDKMQARNGSYSEERPQIAKCCLGCLSREGVLSRPVILPFVEFRFRAKLYQPKNWIYTCVAHEAQPSCSSSTPDTF